MDSVWSTESLGEDLLILDELVFEDGTAADLQICVQFLPVDEQRGLIQSFYCWLVHHVWFVVDFGTVDRYIGRLAVADDVSSWDSGHNFRAHVQVERVLL